MMEHPGADDLIEAHFQIAYPLDGKLVDLEVVQVVFPLELLGVAHTGRAEVDAGHPSRRPAQGMLGRLRCPAAGNQDGLVFPIGSGRPEEMIVRPASLPVLPEPSIFLQAVDRRWIRMPFVEARAPPPQRSRHPLFVIRGLSRYLRCRKEPMHGMVPCMGRSTEARGAPTAMPARPCGGQALPVLDTCAITASRLNEAGFWRGGNLTKSCDLLPPPSPASRRAGRHVIDHPVQVGVRVVLGPLERVATQVEDVRHPQLARTAPPRRLIVLARCSASTNFQSPTRTAMTSPSSLK